MKSILGIALCVFVCQNLLAQAPSIDWQRCLGGTSSEEVRDIIQTSDGGYIATGSSASSDGDAIFNHGSWDAWIVKMDLNGSIEWQKNLGGSSVDMGTSITETFGGYVMAGYTGSEDGDVTNHKGDVGVSDFWVVQVDFNGNIVWQKTFGGKKDDRAYSIIENAAHEYYVTGYSNSINGDVTGHHGTVAAADVWVVKLNYNGDLLWQKSFGGISVDAANNIISTTDGNLLITGYTYSSDGDVTGLHGNLGYEDYWVVKLTSSGVILWQKTLGGTKGDRGYGAVETFDGGYILTGSAQSNDGDVTGNHAINIYDAWTVKLESDGDLLWQRSFGSSGSDIGYAVSKTNDGNYVIGGVAGGADGDISQIHTPQDFWIFKIDGDANLLWEESLGGNSADYGYAVASTGDNGYIMAGQTLSNDGDVSGLHGGDNYDGWIVKLEGEAPSSTITTLPIGTPTLVSDDPITVDYVVTGTFNAGNVFTAQLSNASGDFSVPTFIGSVSATSSGSINGFVPSAQPYGTNYQIRVVSSDPLVIGSTSGESFTIGIPTSDCPSPTGITFSNITSTSVKFSWNAVPDAEGYKMRYKVAGNNPWTTKTTTGNSKNIKGLSPNTEYVFSVKTYCQIEPNIMSLYSLPYTVTTASLKLDDKPQESLLTITPNPVSVSASIQFTLQNSSLVEICLFDLQGRKIKMISEGDLEAGDHQITFQKENLSSGIYFLQIKSNSSITSQKIVVQ